MGGDAMIRTEALTRSYRQGDERVTALAGLSLEIAAGEFVALMGASGCGKSTLLQILGCLDRPSGGRYCLDGTDVSSLGEGQLAAIRNRRIGFVFQTSHFIDYLDLTDNIALPGVYANPALMPRYRERANQLLAEVGLAHRCHHLPAALSGGERQRAAIARALLNGPALILADEPTGNLDAANSAQVLDLLLGLNRVGLTIVLVTHAPEVAAMAHRTLHMAAGALQS